MHPRLLIVALLLVCAAPVRGGDANRSSMKVLAEKDWDREAASHLLRRAGFGGTPAEIDKLTGLGLEAAVDYLVDYKKIPYRVSPPAVDPMLLEPVDRRKLRELSEDERRAFQQKRRRADRRTFDETRVWWIERMAESPRPFEEKMTLFWHGRFTSGMREVRNSIFMKEQNQFLRRHALGNYRDLVLGISKNRAMLVYLDGNRNVKRAPNENYGRELLELFTLGVGNYTEKDIKAAARAFTGWAFNRDGFQFRGRNHDYGVKKFLGKTGRWDGADIVDIILEQPACSRYLARKMLEFYVRSEPDPRLIEAFAAVLRRNDFELKSSMRTLFQSRAFYHADSRGSLIKSPVELIIGTARQLELPLGDLRAVLRSMGAMSQEIMQPPNVKGWDGGTKWINTATLFNRYNFVGALIQGRGRQKRNRFLDEPRMAGDNRSMDMKMMGGPMEAKSRLKPGPQPAYDPIPTVKSEKLESAEQIVDYYVRHLLATPLSSGKRDELVRYMLGDNESFDLNARGAANTIRMMIRLLCSTPEYQMS